MSRLSNRYWKIRGTAFDGSYKEWEDIDFEGKIHKSIEKEPNKSEITLFNLKEEHRQYLAQDGMSLEIIAGYAAKDLHGQLFKGQIDFVENQRDGTTWKTKLIIKDGAKTTRNAKIEKTFAAGTTNKAVMEAIITVLTTLPPPKKSKRAKTEKKTTIVPLKRGNIDLSTVTGKLAKARTLKGLAIDYYAEFCRSFNLRFQIVDGSLHTVGSNLSTLDEVIILDPDSGLIGVPEQTEEGWKFDSLLRFDLEPGQKVRVKSEALTADILMTDVIHEPKTQGDWLTHIEGTV